jgi:hypothetical protein
VLFEVDYIISEREWKWDKRVYTLTYVNAYKELLVRPWPSLGAQTLKCVKATPTSGPTLTPVRFTAPSTHLLHPWEPATITFPPQLQDGQESLFALMAILQTETMHTDVRVNFHLYSHLIRMLMILGVACRKIMVLDCLRRLTQSHCSTDAG